MKKRKPDCQKAQQRNLFPPGVNRITVDDALSGCVGPIVQERVRAFLEKRPPGGSKVT
jgi:hypothetical protein